MASMGALAMLALRCKRAMSEKGVRARLQNEEVGTNKFRPLPSDSLSARKKL